MSGIFDLRMHVSGLRLSAFEHAVGSRTHYSSGHDSHEFIFVTSRSNLAQGKRGTRAEKF